MADDASAWSRRIASTHRHVDKPGARALRGWVEVNQFAISKSADVRGSKVNRYIATHSASIQSLRRVPSIVGLERRIATVVNNVASAFVLARSQQR